MHRKPARIRSSAPNRALRPSRSAAHECAQPRAPLPTAAQEHGPASAQPASAPEAREVWQGFLAERRRSGPDSPRLESWRNALVELHMPLVRYVARRLARSLPRSVQEDDLVSAGVFGLLDALKGYDPERAVRFKTYASARVRGAILDSLRSDDWVPRLVRLRASQIEKAIVRLSSAFGREPTQAELSAELGIGAAEVARELHAARPRVQHRLADRVRENDSEGEHEWTLQDLRARTPFEDLAGRDTLRSLRSALTHKERFILEQYYEVGHTMREIGELLGLTESRVCQIHTSILARLRAQCLRKAREERERDA